jgi:uncharacterized membrane protein YciS (DUF1049 family)
MKYVIILLLCFGVGFVRTAIAQANNAKPDSTISHNYLLEDDEGDDEFNVFLFSLASVFFAALFGAAVIGGFFAALLLLAIIALISAGILSTSVIVGLYKRSVGAGFKFLLALCGGIIGICFGSLMAFFFTKGFTINTLPVTLTSTLSGLLGGIIIGLITANLVIKLLRYLHKKYVASK